MSVLNSETFRSRVHFLQESEKWTAQQLKDYQCTQLQELIRYAYQSIPYYTELLNSLQLTLSDFKAPEDLKKLPLLTKAIIQSRYADFTPKGVAPETLIHRSTGGSTGNPLTIYMDEAHMAKDKANTEYYVNIAGLNIFDYRSVRLYGDRIPEEVLARGEFWTLAEGRKLIMSCYHIHRQTAPAYVQKLNDFQPAYIHSRPSAIYPLAKNMAALGLKLSVPLQAIFLDGEVLTAGQRNLLEAVFQTRVFLTYGHTEGCAVGVSCRESRLLHFLPQIGILELLCTDGSWVEKDGEKGEMVVTGFNNRMFPLIRYRTMDRGIHSIQICSCGRHYKMLAGIEGRIQDYAVNRHGEAVPVAPAIFNYNDMDWKGIKEFRVRQEAVGKLIFVIVREPDAAESETTMKKRLLAAFQSIFGGTFDLDLEFTSDLARTRIGKFRYLEQKLDMARYGLLAVEA